MSTPDRIRQYLHSHPSATVDQLSTELDLTRAAIHYHIRRMLRNNDLELLQAKSQTGAGRPARQYQLPLSASEHLTGILIQQLLKEHPTTPGNNVNLESLAEKLASAILEQASARINLSGSHSVRLNRLLASLAPLGFRLRWTASRKGPLIHIDSEPLSRLIPDPALVNAILQEMIRQLTKKPPV